MGIRVDQLPRLFLRILKNFDTQVILKEVSVLEEEDALFVEDGNHGEYRPLADEFVDIGVPFVRPPNLVDGRIDLNLCQKINDTAFQRVRKGIGKGGDIVLTHNATVGRLAITSDNDPVFVTNPQTTVWRSKNRDLIDPKFLYYFMCSSGFQEQLDSHKGRNATFDYVSLTKQRSLVIPIVNIDLQRNISQVLGSLDNKITLNRELNQTLEQMAQALFKSWFVDFDPVIDNALAAGNSIPDDLQDRAERRQLQLAKADHQPLPENIRKLFPSEFELTESLGWVPKGWGIGSTDQIAKTNPVSWTAKNAPDVVEYVDLSNAKNGVIEDTIFYEFNEAPSRAKRVLEPHDTVFGLVRPGNRSFAYVHNQGLTGSTGFAAMRPRSENLRAFLYFHLTRDDVVDEFARIADGAAYPAIRPEELTNLETVIPSEEILNHYQNIAGNALNKMGQNYFQNKELSQLRDNLLPKLISGELRIPEAP